MKYNLNKNQLNHFAVHLKLTQHSKSTILQLKKNVQDTNKSVRLNKTAENSIAAMV